MICNIEYCQNYSQGECMLKNNKKVCTDELKVIRWN